MLLTPPGEGPVLRREQGIVTLDTLGATLPDAGPELEVWPQTATGLTLALDRLWASPSPAAEAGVREAGPAVGGWWYRCILHVGDMPLCDMQWH